MDDNQIIDLYFRRSEEAITQTDAKYGKLCYSIAYNVLSSREDSEESVSDTYMAAWNQIPPTRPRYFPGFLGKIVRNLSINRWESMRAQKRGGGQTVLALEELGECVDGSSSVEDVCQCRELTAAYQKFIRELPEVQRNVFLRRYFFLDPIAVIAADFGFSQSKVNSMLSRTRSRLKQNLQKEGYL